MIISVPALIICVTRCINSTIYTYLSLLLVSLCQGWGAARNFFTASSDSLFHPLFLISLFKMLCAIMAVFFHVSHAQIAVGITMAVTVYTCRWTFMFTLMVVDDHITKPLGNWCPRLTCNFQGMITSRRNPHSAALLIMRMGNADQALSFRSLS